MGKRIVVGILWFFVVAYMWNFVALFAGVSDVPGLLLGLVAAYLFAGDPLHRIYGRCATKAQVVPAQQPQAPQPV